MEIKYQKTDQEAGFALLIALIVVGVVISVGVAILDLTIKQVRLSTNARESDTAFHAANAGMECARYWRRENATEMENGDAISPSCFGVSVGPIIPDTIPETDMTMTNSGDGEAYKYEYQFSWGGGDRCTDVTALVASSSVFGDGMTITNMETQIAGYPDGNSKFCEPGARCTTLSVRGYNQSCGSIGGFGVVEREVLLQF